MANATLGLIKPKSQTQEGLFLLIKNIKMTRKDFFMLSMILNAPDVIMRLRKLGVKITCKEIETTNKFGREVKYGEYVLDDVLEAKQTYINMTTNG